ncbi:exosome complex RNA-binding protein Csl4 [Aeropyrum pernix]|uniref:exosome complex RNA-binding protein Csl4 n=1 Tax=Aeropyrum pernix TaxID=56636 RepID=UPI00103819F0|nr:exosome complex RNA-binding protein Csl4 [Aeropyrum pernix]
MSYSSQGVVEKGKVMPGDVLATIEEFLPGEGVYVDPVKGFIRAAAPGVAYLDMSRRIAYVKPHKKPQTPGPGSEVAALVTGVRGDLVVAEVYGVVRLSPKPAWLYELPSPYSAAIPISHIADEYIKNIEDYYRIGDWILAKIVSRTPPFTLSTVEPRYGVVYAICSRCGAVMEFQSERSMKCPKCGNVEKRKVSIHAKSRHLRIRLVRNLVIYRS